MTLSTFVEVASQKPGVEVADIYRAHFEEYLEKYACTAQELRASDAIMRCRTSEMGGHIWVCDGCGRWRLVWNSCKNRHCPKCGAFEKAQWLARLARILLPTHYHQVVFTTDHAINDLAYINPQALYDLLIATASQLLKEFGQRYLGGDIGFTVALHTWGQAIQPHIHLHCMVTGGALVKTQEGYEWNATEPTWLFPVKELSARFRDAFCAGLRKLYRADKLRLVGSCAHADIEQMVAKMQAKEWEVFIQKPPTQETMTGSLDEVMEQLKDPMCLAEYLGLYVHQSAIANSRLEAFEDGVVSFWYYDNQDADDSGRGQRKLMALDALEFIRRYLRHVLPHGYIRIRHFGLHASGARPKLQAARVLLGLPFELPPKPALVLSEWLQSVLGKAVAKCAFCQQGAWRKWRKFDPLDRCYLVLVTWLGLAVSGHGDGGEDSKTDMAVQEFFA
ncbi:MAG: transposase [Caldilineaceae bacterium]